MMRMMKLIDSMIQVEVRGVMKKMKQFLSILRNQGSLEEIITEIRIETKVLKMLM